MVTSISATSSSTVVAEIQSTKLGFFPSKRCIFYHNFTSKLYFPVSPKPKIRLFFSKPLPNRMVALKTQSNKVAVEGSNNAPATSEAKSGLPIQEENDEPLKESFAAGLASEESISEFINQVSDLVKLVDSRDIEELKLKQLDCEILIRKRLAIPLPQTHAPSFTMQSPPPIASPTSSAPPGAPPTPVPALLAPVAKSAKSSIPPVLSPMAGTFYRSPAPGEPPFVKVGDKVQKGQVLCIIEAMKLMNEIQAEQAGTVVEVIAEDGKPVSKDSPLFVIQP